MTTPYVLTGASADDWTAYLNKQVALAPDTGQVAGDSDPDDALSAHAARREALRELLKYGNQNTDWMEQVFQAYQDFQDHPARDHSADLAAD